MTTDFYTRVIFVMDGFVTTFVVTVPLYVCQILNPFFALGTTCPKRSNKTGTSKVGAISKAQKAQSFLNMPRMYS